MKAIKCCTVSVCALALSAGVAHAQDSLTAAITGGDATLDLRYRFEFVDQDGRDNNAEASTIRTRLGYRTGAYRGATGLIEFSDTRTLLVDNYGSADRPPIADPELTVLNRAYLEYADLPESTARLGRQRIALDNMRWIGNVGWRQQEQTFDAVSLTTRALADTTVTYAYLWQRNTITGARQDQDSHLLNVSYGGLPGVDLTGYGYWLDFSDDAPGLSTQTIGIRLTGSHALGNGLALGYALEYANQQDAFDNPNDIDFNYLLAELGVTATGITLKGSYEVLEGDGTNALQTPLATLHAHNGWADLFLTTPATGLVDRSLSISGSPLPGVTLVAAYHDYVADEGSASYGNEINLMANWQLRPDLLVGAKYANYSADEFGVDTTKAWAYANYSF
ncbi:hypothetical protein CAI21_02925 [Alkalilimnicola ehrlichii]|uniref:Alginate export domain-containing protein n=1 Tax=Alkalilimnicola ehrlichii TaxID=351052 RepID=A0A3E0X3J8_9GAMM|nr:alginate export family protein [Alkalilimnicola ehrlichii]RFA30947.1 hypothetical protein CAI21_02925 [Alkalilimnicola ehrlichii]RFA38897.1 hypothetical protein CAL65_03065 [Alkalilimnicola ehrlichii]